MIASDSKPAKVSIVSTVEPAESVHPCSLFEITINQEIHSLDHSSLFHSGGFYGSLGPPKTISRFHF